MRSLLPKAKEHDLQAAAVDALRLAGLFVFVTTAYRQKGASGVQKGAPDLLVCVPGDPIAILLEFKRPDGRWSCTEQKEAFDAGRIVVARSPCEACSTVARIIGSIRPSWPGLPRLREFARQLEVD